MKCIAILLETGEAPAAGWGLRGGGTAGFFLEVVFEVAAEGEAGDLEGQAVVLGDVGLFGAAIEDAELVVGGFGAAGGLGLDVDDVRRGGGLCGGIGIDVF